MVIITGASRGIGKFLLEKFLSENIKVFGTYNSTPIGNVNQVHMSKVDISYYSQVNSWIEEIRINLDKIVLINSAGSNYSSFAHKADPGTWEKVIKTNLIGSFNVIQKVLPIMREQNYGRIINFSSVVAQMGIPGTSAYAASKAGLWGLTKSIAVENASKGITINTLNLGYFNIGMIEEVKPEMQTIIKSKIPSGSFGDPEDIYRTIQYIINCSYLNGSVVDINGGLY